MSTLMKPKRIYVSPDNLTSGIVRFDSGDSVYLRRVLRLKRDDLVRVFDGRSEYLVRLTDCRSRRIAGEVVHKVDELRDVGIDVTLAFSCVRPGPLEQILRHGTELGVSRFVPLLSRRSARRPEERKSRWESIVVAAAGQSGRITIPAIEVPVGFDEFVNRPPHGELRLVLSLAAAVMPLQAILDRHRPREVTVAIGPEGGWDPSEEGLALNRGYIPISLVQGILRTETAALVATGLVAAWGHWNTNRQEPAGPSEPMNGA